VRRPLTVAVLGAGASGTLTAAALLDAARPLRPVRVLLMDPFASSGRGVAYGTGQSQHLLNVPAGSMGADPTDPEGFLRWTRRNADESARAADYLPRGWYGAYLAETLHAAADRALEDGRGALLRVQRRAVHVATESSRNNLVVTDDEGLEQVADAVVLATGNPPPGQRWAPPALRRSPYFVADPWAPGMLPQLRTQLTSRTDRLPILLVGTGLTMVDVALSLAGSGRPLLAVSRTGRLPAAHRTLPTGAAPPSELPARSLTADRLRAWFGRHVEEVQAATGDWRPAVDGLRPYTSQLWRRLPLAERARFLSLDARAWERARHRMAPVTAAGVRKLRTSGTLAVRSGTVVAATPLASGLRVQLSAEPGDVVDVAAVINCTGPETDPYAWNNAVVDGLLAHGVASSDPLGLGLRTDLAGRLVDPTGRTSRRLVTLGSPRRGALYETTAIPEIRCQAQSLATLLVDGGRMRQPAPSRSSRSSRTALASA
jgi:uncharacterized NAD(P)/FAD-binding protein YdhS